MPVGAGGELLCGDRVAVRRADEERPEVTRVGESDRSIAGVAPSWPMNGRIRGDNPDEEGRPPPSAPAPHAGSHSHVGVQQYGGSDSR